MTLTGPRPVPMLAPRLGVFHGYYFTHGVTVEEAVALREALSITPTPSIRPNGCPYCDGFGGTDWWPCAECGARDPDEDADDEDDAGYSDPNRKGPMFPARRP